MLLWAGAAFVLLIGAINVANLSFARASVRRRELATRLALGAARVQVARQLLIEALLPAAVGGAAGLAVAALLLGALRSLGITDLPNAGDVGLHARSAGLSAAAALAVASLVAFVQTVAARDAGLARVLHGAGRSATASRPARFFRRGLVIVQVAVSVVLLVSAVLLLTSVRRLLEVDAGFAADGVVTGTVFPPPSRYPDAASAAALSQRVLERVRTLPGVTGAGMTSNIALSGYENPSTVSRVDQRGDEAMVVPSVIAVTPGYFAAMSTALVAGRDFTDADRDGAAQVAIVDEPLAARLWPGEPALGQALMRGDAGPYTVVGVVRPVRFEGLTGPADAIGAAYFPEAQAPPLGRLRWLAVRSSVEPAATARAVRAVMREIDPDLPLADIQTMRERTARSVLPQRLASTLAAGFAVVALLMAMLGLYGVLANLVARRTREIGIRMALGGGVADIYALVLSEGLVLIGIGVALGVGGAVAAAGALRGLMFGVQPTDPWLLSSVAAAAGLVAMLACISPARRATRVDPVRVLSEP
ncbi:MAG: FtsX-like permease family protein [Vicinamibacterales bacterium]